MSFSESVVWLVFVSFMSFPLSYVSFVSSCVILLVRPFLFSSLFLVNGFWYGMTVVSHFRAFRFDEGFCDGKWFFSLNGMNGQL